MQLKVYITVQDAIRAGINGGYHSVEISADVLTPTQREWLASKVKTTSDGTAYIQGPDHSTPDALVNWVANSMAVEAADAAQKAKAKADATDAWLKKPDSALVRSGDNGYGFTINRYFEGILIDLADPRVIERFKKLEVLGQQIASEKEAERKAHDARMESERLARAEALRQDEQRLRDWATQNGSELLRERIEGGYNWQSMAHVEYARSVIARIPDGDQYDIERAADWDISDRNNPGLSEIKALKAVRPFLVGDGPGIRTAELSWCKWEAQAEDDETQKFPALSIMVVCPDEEKIWAHRRLSV